MSWPRAMLFDLDGTLVDSAPDITNALNELLREAGHQTFSLTEVTAMIGGGVSKLVERAFAKNGMAKTDADIGKLASRFLELYAPRATRSTRLYPGVRKLLHQLNEDGYQLGVVTNKPEAISRAMLKTLDVTQFFGAVIGGDTLSVKKPDPAPIAAALEILGCRAQDSLMIGDSNVDSHAARAANVPVILVTYGYTQTPVHEIENDGLIESFSELMGTIATLRQTLNARTA